MASKFGMAGGIPERRVRPIWDAIDTRQFKNALKLSTSLLAKYPNSPYALALKALIVERMGKSDEALSICLNAKELLCTSDSIYIDDLTLSTLQIVFQRLDHLDLATSCYEFACGKFPSNLDLMIGLFNCHVREYSFLKQHQTALKMYKIVGEERFLLWAVCSIQLQVLCGNGGEKLLALAEGLLKKHIASHSLHEPEALIVYISLLEQQSKFRDAFEVISGKLGSLIMIEVDRFKLQGKLLARASDYAAAAVVFQKVLGLCPDDWECFLHYLGCLLEDDSPWCNDADGGQISSSVICKLTHLTDEKFDSGISKASAFIQNLLTSGNDGIRSPYLAYLEIERRKLLFGKGDEDKLIDTLMQYFRKFGHLVCFNSDVEVFLQVLTPGKRTQFVKMLVEHCETPAATPLKALGMSVTVYKVQECMGDFSTLPTSDVETLAVQMVKLYFKNLPLSKDLDPQEGMHGEELLSLASNILVQLFWRTKHLGYLVEAIMVLEFGLTVRRFVWQYKILLLHLYSHWSALSLAYQWYKSLDVKNILLETLSHHILSQMLPSPLWVDLDDLLKDYLKFMDDHFRESADLTFLAYRHRNYSKVIEFVQFKERLQRSSHYLMAKIEAPILQLKQKAVSIEEEEGVLESLNDGVDFLELSSEIRSKKMTFNEDFQSRPWWTPTYDKNYLLGPFEGLSYFPRENKHLIKHTEANVLKTIERKALLPRMIYLSIQCASTSLKAHVESNGCAVDFKFFVELKVLLERYVKFLGFSFQDAKELLSAISSGKETLETLSLDLIEWMNFAVFLNALNLNSKEVQSDKETCRPDTWNMVNTLLEKYISKKLKSIESLATSPGCDLPLLVQLVTEPLAWHCLVLQSCVRSSLPAGKKKKKGASEQTNSHLSQGVRDSVQSVCDIIDEVTNWLREQIKRPVDASVEIVLSSVRIEEHKGPGKVLQVLESSISSIDYGDIGDRITEALKSWSSGNVAKKIMNGHSAVLSEFLRICEAKSKALKALKLQI